MNIKNLTTDVLVVGHGLSGLAAAITVKEENPALKVLTIDKGCVGYAGKANKGGGHVAFIPEGGEEKYVEYHTRNLGDYLNDQDMLRIYANSTIKTMDRWASWGVKFIGREFAQNAHPIIPWKICLVDLDIMEDMARHAKKLGVESINKTALIELISNGKNVTGAVAMNMETEEYYAIAAKSVILANGNQNWKIARMWNSSRGDGIMAAYRAGAKLRNAEFGSFVNFMLKRAKTVAYGAEDVMVNAEGKLCSERADLDPALKSVVGGVDLGGSQSMLMLFDVRDGKGPIYENIPENHFIGSFVGRNLCCYGGQADPPMYRPLAQKFWDKLYYKNRLESFTDDNPLQELVPGIIGEMSPLYVDHAMATSLGNLYGAGDICANGSAWSGAVPTPPGRNRGSGLIHAVFTAILAGESAAKNAAAGEALPLDDNKVEDIVSQRMDYLKVQNGYTPDEIIWEIQNIIQPVEYSGYKSESRIAHALKRIESLKAKLDRIKPETLDGHGLIAVDEAKNIVACAEIFFKASDMRKESRGWHLREDYKTRDDASMLKWIVIQDKGGEMELTFEDIPMVGYKYKPSDPQ